MNRKSLLIPGSLGLSGLLILGYIWWELGDKGLKPILMAPAAV